MPSTSSKLAAPSSRATWVAPGPSPAELETILTIGARVPDHGKLAPWRFIVFEGDARARAGEVIAEVFARKNPNAQTAEVEQEKRRLTDAPLVIGGRQLYKAASQSAGMGTGAVRRRQRDEHRDRGNRARLRRMLAHRLVRIRSRRAGGTGIEADEKLAGFIHIGTASNSTEDRPRPALSEIVTRF